MSDSDREVARVWRVNRTVAEMLRDRGYVIADTEINQTFEDFKDLHGNEAKTARESISTAADHESNGSRIAVYFCHDKNISKAQVKKCALQHRVVPYVDGSFVGVVDGRGAKKGIMIYTEKMSSIAIKAMLELQPDYQLEYFKESDLLVNITRHFLVPKHAIMNPEEKAALLKKYRLKETQLPRIKYDDPVARYYGTRRGQVMKIERKSETAGRYITYRICM